MPGTEERGQEKRPHSIVLRARHIIESSYGIRQFHPARYDRGPPAKYRQKETNLADLKPAVARTSLERLKKMQVDSRAVREG